MNKLPVADTFFRYSPIPGQYKKAGRRGQTNFLQRNKHDNYSFPLYEPIVWAMYKTIASSSYEDKHRSSKI